MKNARSEKVSWQSKLSEKKSSVKTMQKYSYPIELNFKGRTLNFFSSNFNLTNIFYYAK